MKKKEDKLEPKEQKEKKEPQGKKTGQQVGGVVQSLKKKKKISKTSKTSKESSRKKIEVEAEYSMSNERLKAYGLNPKKLKKKLFNQKMNPKD